MRCFFVSDLHGSAYRYGRLFAAIESESPAVVFVGGDLLPLPSWSASAAHDDALALVQRFDQLRGRMCAAYPAVFVIMGNDDERAKERILEEGDRRGSFHYVHGRRVPVAEFAVYGYAYVPPTPFGLKDWERYDVSRYVDPGCVPPEDGRRSYPVDERVERRATIRQDLDELAGDASLDRAVFLFHTPPYRTLLDRAALDGVTTDGVPLDVHVGSLAVRRFIETRQPYLTLHGHIHESARLSGGWKDRIGRTHLLSAAHDGPELALIRFDLERPGEAVRELT